MKIQISEHIIRIVVIAPQERVDASNAPVLRERCQEYLDQGVISFILDLSSVPFLDSAGLAALVSLLTRSRQVGGRVRLIMPKEEAAQRILRLTKFDRVFELAETVEDALQSF